jgi:hypothetical protein
MNALGLGCTVSVTDRAVLLVMGYFILSWHVKQNLPHLLVFSYIFVTFRFQRRKLGHGVHQRVTSLILRHQQRRVLMLSQLLNA